MSFMSDCVFVTIFASVMEELVDMRQISVVLVHFGCETYCYAKLKVGKENSELDLWKRDLSIENLS